MFRNLWVAWIDFLNEDNPQKYTPERREGVEKPPTRQLKPKGVIIYYVHHLWYLYKETY